jgi:hypothetical protein
VVADAPDDALPLAAEVALALPPLLTAPREPGE